MTRPHLLSILRVPSLEPPWSSFSSLPPTGQGFDSLDAHRPSHQPPLCLSSVPSPWPHSSSAPASPDALPEGATSFHTHLFAFTSFSQCPMHPFTSSPSGALKKQPVLVGSGCCNKIPQTAWLINDGNLFLTALWAGSPRSSASMVRFWWEPSSWLIAEAFLLCPYVVGGVRDGSGASFIRALIPFMRVPASHLSTSQRPHLLIPSSLGVRVSTYEFWGDTFRPWHSPNVTSPLRDRLGTVCYSYFYLRHLQFNNTFFVSCPQWPGNSQRQQGPHLAHLCRPNTLTPRLVYVCYSVVSVSFTY